ncbi:CopG family transcriptional regulator [Desulfocurvibacter africanus]|uniref:ribbon-helix-helix domain-containing protein n=1 Tax=Desulfocurvibacter africanus TaxID=873 RepID=UPI00110C5BD8|nr:CopG family transcriptional regulator [Desulfocurvibacter africanus]
MTKRTVFKEKAETYLTPEIKTRLMVMASDRGMTISQLLRRMIIDYCSRYETEKIKMLRG